MDEEGRVMISLSHGRVRGQGDWRYLRRYQTHTSPNLIPTFFFSILTVSLLAPFPFLVPDTRPSCFIPHPIPYFLCMSVFSFPYSSSCSRPLLSTQLSHTPLVLFLIPPLPSQFFVFPFSLVPSLLAMIMRIGRTDGRTEMAGWADCTLADRIVDTLG